MLHPLSHLMMHNTLQRLVLFDIDGTLLSTGGAGRASLQAALEQVYGRAGCVAAYHMGGRTIRQIVRDLLLETDFPYTDIWPSFERFCAVWAATLEQMVNRYPVRAFPGACQLVAALAARDDVLLGLLTANTCATAAIKLRAAGFDPTLFRVGAFGDLSETRADLVPCAIRQATALTGVDFAPHRVILVGDSPLDVICAHQAGVRCIAVSTGDSPRPALEAVLPDCLLDDLHDQEAVLVAILTPT